jgi:hypothetical protein
MTGSSVQGFPGENILSHVLPSSRIWGGSDRI